MTAATATVKLLEKLSTKRLLAKKLVIFKKEKCPSTVKAEYNTTITGNNKNTTNNNKTTKKTEKEPHSMPFSWILGNLTTSFSPHDDYIALTSWYIIYYLYEL